MLHIALSWLSKSKSLTSVKKRFAKSNSEILAVYHYDRPLTVNVCLAAESFALWQGHMKVNGGLPYRPLTR